MDEYIKVDDIKSALCEAVDKGVQLRRGTTIAIIKILGTVPRFEINKDSISREWVLEEFEKGKEKISKSEYFDELMWLVKHAPNVIPNITEGEWKRHPIHENRAWDICTACGTGCRRRHYGFNDDGTEWVEEANYPFCPNCGARMRG